MSAEPVREAFEAWLNPGRHAGNVSPWVEPGRYEKDTHNMAWLAWKAADALGRATLDAAVAAARAEERAAERERCDTLARHALDAATEGNWAYAAVLLQRIKGKPSGSDTAAIRDLKPD